MVVFGPLWFWILFILPCLIVWWCIKWTAIIVYWFFVGFWKLGEAIGEWWRRERARKAFYEAQQRSQSHQNPIWQAPAQPKAGPGPRDWSPKD